MELLEVDSCIDIHKFILLDSKVVNKYLGPIKFVYKGIIEHWKIKVDPIHKSFGYSKSST